VLDEPFAALDAGSIDRLAARLAQHVEAGGAVVLTTHQPVPLPDGRTRRLRLDA
jgi:heme exporter protein A